MMQTQSFLENGTSMRHSRQTRKRHKLHSAPRFMYPNTRQHRAHADFESIIGRSNEPPTLMEPFRRNTCKSERNALHVFQISFHFVCFVFYQRILSIPNAMCRVLSKCKKCEAWILKNKKERQRRRRRRKNRSRIKLIVKEREEIFAFSFPLLWKIASIFKRIKC